MSIIQARARQNIWHGSVRSGKTFCSLLAWLVDANKYPESGTSLMAGRNLSSLKRNILDLLTEIESPDNFSYSLGSREAQLYGKRVYLLGANDERAEANLRGLTLGRAYGDEITLWPESFYAMLLSRLSVPGARLFATTNPDSPRHWLKTKFLDAADLDLNHWSFRLDDNPYLAKEYVDSLKAEYRSMGSLWYKRYVEGIWAMAEGAIYDMWDDDLHLKSRIEWPRYIVGIDYGTSNPTVFLLLGHDSRNCQVVDEYYHHGIKQGSKTPEGYANDLQKWLGDTVPSAIYCDPSANYFITECKLRGLPIAPGNNRVLEGITLVSEFLSKNRLTVAPQCKNLIGEIGAYFWDPSAQAKGFDQPIKENDHALDALRYAITGHFSGRRMKTEIRSYDYLVE